MDKDRNRWVSEGSKDLAGKAEGTVGDVVADLDGETG